MKAQSCKSRKNECLFGYFSFLSLLLLYKKTVWVNVMKSKILNSNGKRDSKKGLTNQVYRV